MRLLDELGDFSLQRFVVHCSERGVADSQLHRLLGVPIPPDLVSRHSSASIDRDRDSTTTPRANSPDPERSYVVMDDTLITPSPSWSAMLKNTLSLGLTRARRSSSPGRVTPVPTPPPMVRGESFVDMSTMNEKEKSVARRKAQKLEYVRLSSSYLTKIDKTDVWGHTTSSHVLTSSTRHSFWTTYLGRRTCGDRRTRSTNFPWIFQGVSTEFDQPFVFG